MEVVYTILVVGALASLANVILQGYWFYHSIKHKDKDKDD